MRMCWVIIIGLLFLAGCPSEGPTSQPAAFTAPKAQTPQPKIDDDPPEPGIPGRTHLVLPRETLYSLAQRYYGNSNQWRKIYYANRNRLGDPNDVPVGIRLIIPP